MTGAHRVGVHSARLGGGTAVIVHRLHDTVNALIRQLNAIGLRVEARWPDLQPGDDAAEFLFFDADQCHDSQFPWNVGHSPMPMIALVGSEAPGRIDWALEAGAMAHLMKPVGASGAHAALLMASRAFAARAALTEELNALRARLGARETVVRAVIALTARGDDEREAYARLRSMAMAWQVTIETAATRILGDGNDRRHG